MKIGANKTETITSIDWWCEPTNLHKWYGTVDYGNGQGRIVFYNHNLIMNITKLFISFELHI